MQVSRPCAPVADDEYRRRIENAGPDALSKDDILDEFQAGVDDRINGPQQSERYPARGHIEAIPNQ